MSGPVDPFARQVPASRLARGWHVEFSGRWWLVQGVYVTHDAVAVMLAEHVFALDAVPARLGLLTAVWARDPGAQMQFAVAAERERRGMVLNAAADRLGAAMVLAGAA